jgi:hypothetical protein
MSLSRLALSLAALALLAACDNSPKPPPGGQEASTAPTTTTTTAAEAPPATTTTTTAVQTPPPETTTVAATPAPQQSAAGADGSDALTGSWAADPANCATRAITITPTTFEGAENRCEIGNLTDNQDGSFSAALSCTSEGQSASETIVMRPIFGPLGEGINLTYPDRDNLDVTVFRCEEPVAATR